MQTDVHHTVCVAKRSVNQALSKVQNRTAAEAASSSHYFQTGRTGGPTRNAGFAPFLGTNFCARPLSTSATYKFPSWSTWRPWTPHIPPGKSPQVPQEYWKCPSRSYLTSFDVPRSAAHRCRSARFGNNASSRPLQPQFDFAALRVLGWPIFL